MSLVKLARSLRPRRSFYCFEYSELRRSKTPRTCIEDIAEMCVADIRSVQKSGPYYLGGHCWGGTLAFSIAAKLETEGESIAVLLLLESFPLLCDEEEIQVGTGAQTTLSSHPDGYQEAMDQIVAKITQQLSMLPAELADRVGRLTSEQLTMGNRYRARPIHAPLALIRTSIYADTLFEGWKYLSSGEFTEQIVPGDTYSMLEPPYVGVLATELVRYLSPALR